MSRTFFFNSPRRETIKKLTFLSFLCRCAIANCQSLNFFLPSRINFRLDWRRSKKKRDNNCPERLFGETDGQLWMRRKKNNPQKFRWKILTTRPAGKLPYLQNRGTFNFPSTFASFLLPFSFLRSILLRPNVMLMIGQETSEIAHVKGKQTEFWRTHTQRRNEDINYKVLILEGTAEWDKWFINCECQNQHENFFLLWESSIAFTAQDFHYKMTRQMKIIIKLTYLIIISYLLPKLVRCNLHTKSSGWPQIGLNAHH